jgi:hypothetical protein
MLRLALAHISTLPFKGVSCSLVFGPVLLPLLYVPPSLLPCPTPETHCDQTLSTDMLPNMSDRDQVVGYVLRQLIAWMRNNGEFDVVFISVLTDSILGLPITREVMVTITEALEDMEVMSLQTGITPLGA